MAIPDYQTLMLPVLKLAKTGEFRINEAAPLIAKEFNLTEEEKQARIPSGTQTTINNRVMWAVTYMVKAGLLHRPQRGYFTVTEKGKEILSQKPGKIDVKFLQQFPEFEKFRTSKREKGTERTSTEGDTTPEEKIGLAYEDYSEGVKSDVLSKVLEASPEFFEKLIVQLLLAMGYGGSDEEAGKHLGKSGDEGIDGVINEDKLGLDIIYIQAKRYKLDNTVGRPDVQKFAGSLMGKKANKGVFVTTSFFSKEAYEFVKTIQQRIILIDGDMLTSFMLQHNVGVRVDRTFELKKIDEDFFLD